MSSLIESDYDQLSAAKDPNEAEFLIGDTVQIKSGFRKYKVVRRIKDRNGKVFAYECQPIRTKLLYASTLKAAK